MELFHCSLEDQLFDVMKNPLKFDLVCNLILKLRVSELEEINY